MRQACSQHTHDAAAAAYDDAAEAIHTAGADAVVVALVAVGAGWATAAASAESCSPKALQK